MRGSLTLFATLLVIGLGVAPTYAADPLAPYLWTARPVVVLADRPDDPLFERQIAALDAHESALADYEIRVVRVTTEARALRAKLGVAGSGFAVALVGKDGSVKETWREPVAPERIFALIDRMPMRREEVRRR